MLTRGRLRFADILTGRQSVNLNGVGITCKFVEHLYALIRHVNDALTSKRSYVVLDPQHGKPLVLEAKIPCYLRFIRGKKTECREPVADVDPNFRALRGDVLRLTTQSVWRAELKKPTMVF